MAVEHSPQPRRRCFAFIYARFIEPLDRKTMARYRKLAAGGARGRVLEIGSGTGANLDFYDWSRVTSLEMTEPDPYMAQHIRPKLDVLPADAAARVRLQQSPAERLPFVDAEFDCAVVTLVLCSVSHPDAAITELRRVLKPGGELRVVEHVQGRGTEATLQRLVQPVYGLISGGCHLNRSTEEALGAAGFAIDVVERPRLGPLCPAFVAVARRPNSAARSSSP